MKKTAKILLLGAGLAVSALALPIQPTPIKPAPLPPRPVPVVPEIDPGSVVNASALLFSAFLMTKGRKR